MRKGYINTSPFPSGLRNGNWREFSVVDQQFSIMESSSIGKKNQWNIMVHKSSKETIKCICVSVFYFLNVLQFDKDTEIVLPIPIVVKFYRPQSNTDSIVCSRHHL